MNRGERRAVRAWRCVPICLLIMVALSVCYAAPKSVSVRSDVKKDAGAVSAPPAAVNTVRPLRSPSNGPETIVRKPGEKPDQLAARILPAGAETITKPLEFELGPLGTVVLVLYQVSPDDPVFINDPSVYRGLVLIPSGKQDNYRIQPLPSQSAGAGVLMYEVKSVFAADADGDGSPELCILSDTREAGDTGRSHTDTDIFKWSGSGFKLVEQDDSRPLSDLRTAKAVRANAACRWSWTTSTSDGASPLPGCSGPRRACRVPGRTSTWPSCSEEAGADRASRGPRRSGAIGGTPRGRDRSGRGLANRCVPGNQDGTADRRR